MALTTNSILTYPRSSTREDFWDIVPAVRQIRRIDDTVHEIGLRNGKNRLIKGFDGLMKYLSWLETHDSLIKTKTEDVKY